MKNNHNNFKSRLSSGETLIGTFQKSPSMMVSEVLARTELDTVCLDAEHSPFDRRDLDACLLALRSEGVPSLVRITSNAPEQILNAFDCGATGVVVPHVDSVEKAEAVVKASKYGPAGRGYAGSTRAAEYASRGIGDNISASVKDNVVIAQIEDLAALESIDDIVAVEGVDCFFIGMADLTVALGCRSLDDAQVVDVAKRISQAARKANRRIGMFIANLDEVSMWQDLGISLFLLGSDHSFIMQGAHNLLAQVKN